MLSAPKPRISNEYSMKLQVARMGLKGFQKSARPKLLMKLVRPPLFVDNGVGPEQLLEETVQQTKVGRD